MKYNISVNKDFWDTNDLEKLKNIFIINFIIQEKQ